MQNRRFSGVPQRLRALPCGLMEGEGKVVIEKVQRGHRARESSEGEIATKLKAVVRHTLAV